MSIRLTSELMEMANQIIGEDNSDASLSFIADLADTLASTETARTEIERLKQQNTDLETTWRKKYRDRFFSGPSPDEPEPELDPPAKLKTRFEDLFETKKG